MVTSDIVPEKTMASCIGFYDEACINAAVERFYREGWIHKIALSEYNDEQGYVLPSSLHRWRLQSLVLAEPLTSRIPYENVLEFSIACIKNFNPSRLNARPAPPPSALDIPTTAHISLPEDHYVAELSRSAAKILTSGYTLVPQYGDKSRRGGGAIDLFLGGAKWGIEVMKDGDRRIDHYRRFEPKGPYYRWIENQSMLDWIILDFRTSIPEGIYPGNTLYDIPFALYDVNLYEQNAPSTTASFF